MAALSLAATSCYQPAMSGAIGGMAAASVIGLRARSPLPLASEALARIESDYAEPIDASVLLRATVEALARDVGAQEPFTGDAISVACGERRTSIAVTEAGAPTWIERLADIRETIQPCLGPRERPGRAEYEYAVIERMTRALGPGSAFLSPTTKAELGDEGRSWGGVGLEITRDEGALVVVSAFPDAPASRAGIRPGDRLVAIDGAPIAGVELVEVVKRLRGKKGTSVSLFVERAEESGARRELVLTREHVTIPPPVLRWLEPSIGHLKIGQLSEGTSGHVGRALDAVRARDGAAVIVDLRQNPGGLLLEALRIGGFFLPAGAAIVALDERRPGKVSEELAVETVEGGGMRRRYVLRAGGERIPGRRVVVLVDRGTAAGAEFIAGALRDHGATLGGSRTFGNGSVSTIFPLAAGALRLVTARASTPSGHPIDARGIEPHVALDPPPLGKMGTSADGVLAWAIEAARR